MSIVEIIILGIVQGLTEFLPVSSSGHLVLFQHLFGLREPQILADIMLHVGTLISLVIFLRRDLAELGKSFWYFLLSPRKHLRDQNIKLLFFLLIASIPTALIGYFFHGFFESLFGSPQAVGGALVITGALLFLTKFAREKESVHVLHPVFIGILQGLAIVPGFSRSGFTISGALLLGWRRKEAARFSFLLFIPAILGATLFKLHGTDLPSHPWPILLTGCLVAAVSGFLALSLLLKSIQRGKFSLFSYYCFFIGTLTLIISL